MERFERTLPYFIVMILAFTLLPLAITFTALSMAVEEGTSTFSTLNLLYYAVPFLDLCIGIVVGFFFGKNVGGDWLVALEAGIAFIPGGCYFSYIDLSALRDWLFVLFIVIATLIGIVLGKVFGDRFGRR